MSRALTCLFLVVAAPAAGAPLTFDEAIGLTAQVGRVAGAREAVAVKREANDGISRMTSNPTLSVQPGYRLLRGGEQGFEVLAGLSQSWNLSGLGARRRESAGLEAELLDAESREVALVQRLEAARAWTDLWGAQRVLDEARREAAVARDFTALIEKAARSSAVTQADLADAQAYLSEANLAVISAEGEVFERGLTLSREVGKVSGEPGQAAGDLPEPGIPPQADWPRLLEEADRLPEVRVRALRVRVERAREVEEKALRGATLSLGLVVQRDQPDGLSLYGVAGLGLPLFDRGQRERGVLLASAARAAGERATAAQWARAEVAMALHEIVHTGEILGELRDRLVPATQQAVARRERIYQAGEATILEVLQARRLALSAVSRRDRALSHHVWAKVRAWLLVAALAGEPPKDETR